VDATTIFATNEEDLPCYEGEKKGNHAEPSKTYIISFEGEKSYSTYHNYYIRHTTLGRMLYLS
jgi:hypothetical protein